MRKLNDPRVSAYLQKPYRVAALLAKMHDLLAGGEEAQTSRN
jgi:hypothetical protein